MILEGKTIAVSGAGPGLGKEVAACALRDGANVVLGARTEKKLEDLAAELDPTGKRVAIQPFDVVDEAKCQAFAQKGVDSFGALHGVVNVAAFDTLFGTLESTSAEDWTKALTTNVIGSTQVAKACVPHIAAAGGGAVILIGSLSMWLPPPNKQIAYASSKGALISAMYHMAEELGPKKIRVNMVIPTWMWGPPVQMYVRWQASERKVDEQVIIDEITANMPLGEIPKDEDVAEMAVFLCSDRARMVTGETIQVNAGEFMRG